MAIDDRKLADLKCDVTLVGGGKMGLALLTGWLDAGIRPSMVQVVDLNPSAALRAISAHWNVAVETAPKHLRSGIIVWR